MELDIVELIEKNPITKFSSQYNGKFLTKIKETFTGFEQQLFLTSFYCYLNYNPKTDFVVDLDNIWKWLDFYQKENARRLLENQFIKDIDYIILPILKEEQKKGSGGHNKKKIFLTIKAFKSFCLKAGTKKADEIHEYYMKMEEIIQDTINEESNELKLQLDNSNKKLQQTNKQLEEQKIITETEKQELLEKIKTHVKDFAISYNDFYEDPDKRNYIVSNEKLESTGWGPQWDLDRGIKELIMAYQMIVPKMGFEFRNGFPLGYANQT